MSHEPNAIPEDLRREHEFYINYNEYPPECFAPRAAQLIERLGRAELKAARQQVGRRVEGDYEKER